ncbi:MAG: hypothetical protein WKF40_11440 [Thermoleophilaceae bacterium]
MLVALLVLYPVVIATLIGFALSRGPDKPRVAFANLVPSSGQEIDLGGKRIDVARQAGPAVPGHRPGTGQDSRGGGQEGARRRRPGRPGDPRGHHAQAADRVSSRRPSTSTTTPTIRSRPPSCATRSSRRSRTPTTR